MVTFNKIYLGSLLKGKVYKGSVLIHDSMVVSIPAVPTGLTTSDIQSDSITIIWNAVAGADSYDIQFREQGQGWTDYTGETGTSRQFTGLNSSTIYEFQVRATNTAGSSDYTATESATTSTSAVAFEAIINFEWQFKTGNGVNYTNITQAQASGTTPITILNLSDGSASGATFVKTGSSGNASSGAASVSALDGYDQNSYETHFYYSGSGGYYDSKISGLNQSKTYTIKIVSIKDLSSSEIQVTIGGVSKTKDDSENIIFTWTGISPDTNGDIFINAIIKIFGRDFGGALNLIHIIEE